MMNNRRRYAILLAAIVPALALLPLLAAPLPTTWHPAREVAGFFQALAFVRTGFESYFFLTPEENLSAIHLHSLLSSPFIAVGFYEGGRLISIAAAVATAAILAKIADELGLRRAALLVPPLIWLQPLFVRLAGRHMTDTLSTALTGAAVLAVLRYLDTGDRRWFVATNGLLVLAISNHMWEATIALPIVVLLAHRRDYARAVTTAVVVVAAVAVIWYITSLQPSGASTLTKYGTHTVGVGVFFTPNWWLQHWQWPPHPINVHTVLLLPLSIVLAVWFGRQFVRERDRISLLLTAWFASGMSIPLFLAGGVGHMYHFWALMAPLALSGAIFLARGLDHVALPFERDTAVRGVMASLLVIALIYGAGFEAGAFAREPSPIADQLTDPTAPPLSDGVAAEEAVAAGRTIGEMGASNVSRVVFVGHEWNESRQFYRRASVAQILIYSGLLPRERSLPNTVNEVNPDGPTFWLDNESLPECEAVVYRNGENVSVRTC